MGGVRGWRVRVDLDKPVLVRAFRNCLIVASKHSQTVEDRRDIVPREVGVDTVVKVHGVFPSSRGYTAS